MCLTRYKFQVHPGRVLGLHLLIDGMNFKGSEGSSTFGDPEDLNLEKSLHALLNVEYVFCSNYQLTFRPLTEVTATYSDEGGLFLLENANFRRA